MFGLYCFIKQILFQKLIEGISIQNWICISCNWNNVVYSCNTSKGMSLSMENLEMKQCVCRYNFGDEIGPWDEHCP